MNSWAEARSLKVAALALARLPFMPRLPPRAWRAAHVTAAALGAASRSGLAERSAACLAPSPGPHGSRRVPACTERGPPGPRARAPPPRAPAPAPPPAFARASRAARPVVPEVFDVRDAVAGRSRQDRQPDRRPVRDVRTGRQVTSEPDQARYVGHRQCAKDDEGIPSAQDVQAASASRPPIHFARCESTGVGQLSHAGGRSANPPSSAARPSGGHHLMRRRSAVSSSR